MTDDFIRDEELEAPFVPIHPDDLPPDVLDAHAVPEVISGTNVDEPEIDWDSVLYESAIRNARARGGK
jgi:hypothetical protein